MELTKEEKIAILNQHLKNVLSTKYNLEIAVIKESAGTTPDESIISNLNEKIVSEEAKHVALLEQYSSLSE
jgi:hypothetical protein